MLIIKLKIKMKIVSTFLVAFLLGITGQVFSVKAQDAPKPASGISWTATTLDFGKIEQGKPVTAEFEFKNPSMVPLIISNVKPSCGCTVADFPKEPVQPGKTGKISVTYNAAASGFFQKSILVTSNATEGNSSLIIKGEVVPKK
jgi:hypothetical protein